MKLEPHDWHCFATAEEVALAACRQILAAAKSAIARSGQFKLVLAGGTTPEKVYRLLAKTDADWSHWWLYHGDERCLPPDHPDRNSLMATQAWLGHVPIPKAQIFDIPAELGAEQGALAYAEIVKGVLPFDLVLLGMGEDGHTASLFPGHVYNPEEWVHAVHNSPKPPPDRVSLSAKALTSSKQIVFLITGANKQEAVSQWLSGAALPVASVFSENSTIYIDQAAFPRQGF